MKIEDAIAESKAFKKVAKILYDKSTRCRFYEKLAALIDNGKQMQLSIENLQERASKKSKTDAEAIVLKDVYLKIQQGASLGDALAEYIPMGERMLIMAGEQSGTLPQALNMCAELIKASQKMLGRVLAAIAQPLILGAVLACALLVISKSVVPKLEMVYPAEHWEGAARNLYLVASFVDTPWFLVLLGFLFIFFVTIAVTLPYWKGRIRPFFDKIPPWSFYRILQGAGWLLSLSAMLRCGTTLHSSIAQIKQMAGGKKGNPWLFERMDLTLWGINNGLNIGDSLDRTKTGFPDQEIIDDLIVYSDLQNFDDTLHKLGAQFIDSGLKKIDEQAKILNTAVKIFFGLTVAMFAFGIMAVQMQITEYFNSISGM
jgi:type II secretory pathway component PulF